MNVRNWVSVAKPLVSMGKNDPLYTPKVSAKRTKGTLSMLNRISDVAWLVSKLFSGLSALVV